jgi:hypothetical protein
MASAARKIVLGVERYPGIVRLLIFIGDPKL